MNTSIKEFRKSHPKYRKARRTFQAILALLFLVYLWLTYGVSAEGGADYQQLKETFLIFVFVPALIVMFILERRVRKVVENEYRSLSR